MEHMSRAERRKQIERVFADYDRKYKGHTMNMGMVGRKIGLVPSTHLKGILNEMADDDILQELSTAPNRYGQTFRAWRYLRTEQMELPDEYINICGVWMNKNTGEEVQNVQNDF